MKPSEIVAIARQKLALCKGQPLLCSACNNCIRFDNTVEKNHFEGVGNSCYNFIANNDYSLIKKTIKKIK